MRPGAAARSEALPWTGMMAEAQVRQQQGDGLMIQVGGHGEVGIPANRMRSDGMGRVLPRYVGQHLLQSQSRRVARSGARSYASMESERSSSQISRAEARHGETLLAQGRAESARITGRQASQRQGMAR